MSLDHPMFVQFARVARASFTMSEQEIYLAVVQQIIIKFLTNEDVKSQEILSRFEAQFRSYNIYKFITVND